MTGFVPYVPPPPAEQLAFLPFLRAVRSNALDMFTAAAYSQPVVTRRQIGRTTLVLNAPEAIQHVLMTNEANYARTPAAASWVPSSATACCSARAIPGATSAAPSPPPWPRA
jgi:hypothetical protein